MPPVPTVNIYLPPRPNDTGVNKLPAHEETDSAIRYPYKMTAYRLPSDEAKANMVSLPLPESLVRPCSKCRL